MLNSVNLGRLKRDIEAMGTTTDENVKSKLRQSFLELFSNIQVIDYF